MLPPMTLDTPADLLRPQFHFTAPAGWLNDPNGLVYHKGEYHLFYQHNPFGTQWGNMTWGHAVSKDLVHWQNLPNALEPDSLGTMFSGSAVIDKQNTSGLGTKKNPPMVLLYTAAGDTSEASKGKPFTQCLAWSTDGRTFHKFAENPVLPHVMGGNRDPKVIWHEASKQWVMALYLDGDLYRLYGSPNLKQWQRLSDVRLENTSECPDFFPMRLDGDRNKMQWVFWGANGNYRVGNFDGKTFTPTTPLLHTNYGNTGYAAQTYSNLPNDRRVQISWLNNSEFPGCPWNQQMSVPNEMKLVTTVDGPRLALLPVKELERLRSKPAVANDGLYEVPSGLVDLEGRWKLSANGTVRVVVNEIEITFDRSRNVLSCLGKEAGSVVGADGVLNLRVLADRASVEIYAQRGLVWMPMYIAPKADRKHSVSVTASTKGSVRVTELTGS